MSAYEGLGFISKEDFIEVSDMKSHDKSVINDAKDRSRADLDLLEWAKQGWAYEKAAVNEPVPYGNIAYEDANRLSVEDFIAKYEAPNLPVLIRGLTEGWPAVEEKRWSIPELYRSWRHRKFKCGEDDDGYPVKIKLKYFLRYMACQRDDSPLYIFDSMYDDERRNCPILHDYTVPKYFTDDFFRLVGEHRRPPYRWFLIGPVRSGTTVHIDPLNTSAWNTLIAGRKRWVLFPPTFTRECVKGRHHVRKESGEDDEAIDYFNKILPRIKEEIGPAKVKEMMEFTQQPGETIFVPGGWWHAVMNLDDTIAVTQNFCSTANFERVWKATREGRRGMARKLLRVLRDEHPAIYAKAAAMNAADGWDIDAEAKRHRARVLKKRELEAKRKALKEARKRARKDGDDDSDDSSSSSSSSESSSSGSETSESEAERCGVNKEKGCTSGAKRPRSESN